MTTDSVPNHGPLAGYRVIENFRPGALEAWGLGYDELASIRD